MSFSVNEETGVLSITSDKLNWDIRGDEARPYIITTLPFEVAQKYLESVPFNDNSGKGEQRTAIESHVKKLKKEMLGGRFTPTMFGANTTKRHEDKIVEEGKTVTIEVPEEWPLHQTDGAHRFEALKAILEEADELNDEYMEESVNNLPIPIIIYLGQSDAQQDFINLQSGKTVDSNMVNVLKIRKNQLSPKLIETMRTSLEVARAINDSDDSVFCTHIRMDTISSAYLKFTSLASKSASDGASSIVGMVRVLAAGKTAEAPFCTGEIVELAANTIIATTNYLKDSHSQACDAGFLLSPPPNGGPGSNTLLIGVGTVFAYERITSGESEITAESLEALKIAVESTLATAIGGDLSASRKRSLMKSFAAKLFENTEEMCTDGIPNGLLEILGNGSFGMPK